jgi:hypothetical protein
MYRNHSSCHLFLTVMLALRNIVKHLEACEPFKRITEQDVYRNHYRFWLLSKPV